MLQKGAIIFNFYKIKIVKFITYTIHSVPNSVNLDKFTSLIITSWEPSHHDPRTQISREKMN